MPHHFVIQSEAKDLGNVLYGIEIFRFAQCYREALDGSFRFPVLSANSFGVTLGFCLMTCNTAIPSKVPNFNPTVNK